MATTATFEKAAGALLVALLLALGLDRVVDGYVMPVPKPPAEAAGNAEPGAQPAPGGGQPQQQEDAVKLIASADPQVGARVAKQCMACHTFEKGGPNKVGPNLYSVIGGPKAHRSDFAYSSGMAELHSQTWSYEDLDKFLSGPGKFVKGTKMTFAGLRNASDRAAVIQFLRQNSDNPPPLPNS